MAQKDGSYQRKRIEIVATSRKFPKLKAINLGVCEDYILGKQKAVKFSKRKNPKEKNLDQVHYDVWEPASVQLLGGARYFSELCDCHLKPTRRRSSERSS